MSRKFWYLIAVFGAVSASQARATEDPAATS
jgi:hypothetical protein